MTVQMWMKIAGAVMVVSGASGFGFWLAGQYGQRLRELEQLRQMIFLLKGQILYANAPLSEAFEIVGSRTEGPLSELFLRVAGRIDGQQGETFRQIWKEEVEAPVGPGMGLAMSKGDKETLRSLGEHLGFLDRDMQERNLLLYLEQLDMRIGQMRDHKQERCRLYTSLGVMGGLFLAILLV